MEDTEFFNRYHVKIKKKLDEAWTTSVVQELQLEIATEKIAELERVLTSTSNKLAAESNAKLAEQFTNIEDLERELARVKSDCLALGHELVAYKNAADNHARELETLHQVIGQKDEEILASGKAPKKK